jgi:ferredoxin-NADP reductase
MASSDYNESSVDAFAPISTQTWSNGRHKVRCVKVIEETRDVRTFCFMADQPVIFFFKPGQFVTLELEIEGEQIMRSYTISSSPSVPYSFSITAKRIPYGKVSNWLHDNIVVGSDLAIHGPVGSFNCIDYPSDKLLFLSGGVGITPVMSMTRWFFDTNADIDMVFSHSARTPKDIIYRRELEHMCSRIENFSLHLICETYESGQAWHGYRGFLDEAKLTMIAPDFMDREIFCCGPTPYMDAVKKILQINNFDMKHYHEELFGSTPKAIAATAEESAAKVVETLKHHTSDDMVEVSFYKSGKSILGLPDETIHAAAARIDLNIPRACGMGVCGTCKVLKLEGEVSMDDNGGITDEDKAAGYILSCCSVAKGRVVIEF